ncbi:hypothetical protein KUTeg_017626 [Tegillarca granosa]|uniref:Uncharacterized protein n=1 Tax=Tegillarca granosa TaxID=220873 RepID=A0ABQ9EFG3_TEGGR|nr:hypothetical protein KUTeg_017626 [Tegillarca granosa]
MQGSLIAAGAIHCLVGVTGLVGLLLRFIGPVTIVPTVLLTGLYITRATTDFAKVHWGVSAATAMLALILSLYLGNYKTPVPVWTRSKGFHVTRYPLHQAFSILIAMLFGWILSAILTAAGAFSEDPKSSDHLARTDARTDILHRAHWFYVPYPGNIGNLSIVII